MELTQGQEEKIRRTADYYLKEFFESFGTGFLFQSDSEDISRAMHGTFGSLSHAYRSFQDEFGIELDYFVEVLNSLLEEEQGKKDFGMRFTSRIFGTYEYLGLEARSVNTVEVLKTVNKLVVNSSPGGFIFDYNGNNSMAIYDKLN